MKDNELDDLLRKKANDIDDSKFNFKIDVNEIKKKAEAKKKYNVLRISFASALAACLVLGALFFILKYQSPEEDNITIQGNDENEKNNENNEEEVIKAENIIDTIVYSGKVVRNPEELSSFIGIIKIEEVHDFGIVDDIPKTVVKANVIQELYVDKNVVKSFEDIVNIKIDSCVCKLEDIPNEILDNNYAIDGYYKIVSNEELKSIPYPEKGKMYIVSLLYLDDEIKLASNSKYSFYEYDPETKKVKIGEEWQDIDFNYIVW